jgi:hypothetical protein
MFDVGIIEEVVLDILGKQRIRGLYTPRVSQTAAGWRYSFIGDMIFGRNDATNDFAIDWYK